VCCVSIYILFFELYSELRKLVEAKLLVNSDIKAQFEIDYLAKLISSRIFQSKEKGILRKNPAAGTVNLLLIRSKKKSRD